MTVTQRAGAAVSVKSVSKHFGAVTAVDDVTIDVAPGEFLALLGPSGSGKTTILSMIAGFEQPSRGDILIGGKDVTRLPPHKREIGMVFQRYALFPHLTVAENLAYPLRRRGADADTIAREVKAALELVQLGKLGPRHPHQLSGGQQQRVALARAMIFRPALLLMDEPLGALDKKLRQQMQMELKLLHRAVNATIVLVTHDQEEALSMADRVAVIADGALQQIGTPDELYGRPANAFVADFIGETNFLPAEVTRVTEAGCEVRITGEGAFPSLSVSRDACAADFQARPGLACRVGIRPEHVQLVQGGDAQVVEAAFAGSYQTVLVQAGSHKLTARVPFSVGQTMARAADRVRLNLPDASCRLYGP